MLDVQSVTKSYGKRKILEDLTFSVRTGEIVGLVGENGAGKSTLLKILSTTVLPSTGEVSLDGLVYRKKHMGNLRRQIGFVPQDIALWEDLTVKENMIFFEKLSWVKKTPDELRQLCLDMKLNKWEEPLKNLSGGMKRKLNLAISLIHDPKLLLLDEPTVGIDLKSRKEIGDYLKNLAVEQDRIILYTSHDMDEINTLCSRIVCIGEDPFYQDILADSGKELVIF